MERQSETFYTQLKKKEIRRLLSRGDTGKKQDTVIFCIPYIQG